MLKISPKARRDILEIIDRIASDNFLAAKRFARAFRSQLLLIQNLPHSGARFILAPKRLAGLRQWPIRGFRQYLIFYIADETLIHVIRVLHSARDASSILKDK